MDENQQDAILPEKPKTPSQWFARKYPVQAERYGMPILEEQVRQPTGLTMVIPRSTNVDFFSSILDPACDNSTIYIPRHLTFYKREAGNTYAPIDAQDVTIDLSREFLRCAEEMPPNVDIEPLFNKCRSKAVLKQIVERARVILKVSDQFLDQEGRSINENSLTPVQCADLFAAQCLRPEPGAVLALKDCYAEYGRFSQEQGWRALPYRDFEKAINVVTRNRWKVGLRHDVPGTHAPKGWGWVGIRIC